MAKEYIPIALRRLVQARAQGHCEYCRVSERYALQSMVCEHIFPLSRGGPTIATNLAWACCGCNGFKSDRTEVIDPVSKQLVPIFHPRQMSWLEHFDWSEDALLVVGRSPIGRATEKTLQLNREGVVNIRQLLCLVGQHPPNF
jgi:HNH endonuclease